jgi:short-subunit dehydrogenase
MLAALADELRGRYGVGVEVLPADLADGRALRRVESRLADEARPVDLLVNNAGVGEAGPFVDCPVDGEQSTVLVNVLAPTRLCHAALTAMMRRDRGGIVNVASVAGLLVAFRNGATYGASKAFLCSLSESLRLEVKRRRSRVAVTVVCPGYVRTDMTTDIALPRIAWVERETVVRAALRGVARNRPLVVPGLLYRAAVVGAKIAPRALVRPFAADTAQD